MFPAVIIFTIHYPYYVLFFKSVYYITFVTFLTPFQWVFILRFREPRPAPTFLESRLSGGWWSSSLDQRHVLTLTWNRYGAVVSELVTVYLLLREPDLLTMRPQTPSRVLSQWENLVLKANVFDKFEHRSPVKNFWENWKPFAMNSLLRFLLSSFEIRCY